MVRRRKVLAPRPLARALALGLALALADPAVAADVRLGWSLGAQQSFQTVLTDSAQAFALTQAVAGSTLSDTLVQRFTGLVLNTGVTANATIDVVGRQWEQGLLVGVALNQLVPTLLPEDAAPNTAPASTAFQANAVYLARLVRPTWTWSLGGGYAFGLNGQLPIGADGGTGAAAGTLPGAQVGPLVISGQTHTASARTLLQLTRARWDADLGFDYTFAANGIFTLAAAAGGGAGAAAGGATSALGAFVPATSHTLAPQLQARRRLSARDTLSASLRGSLVLPVEVELEDELVQNLLPQTANANLTVGFEHVLRDEHRWFVSLGGTLSLRRPSDLALGADGGVSGRALVDPATGDTYGLRTDTLIYTLEVGLQGRVRSLELGYRASAGVAQPRLYQPPLGGASARFPLYEDPVIGAIQPVLALTLDRRFDPVDVSLAAQRGVGLGGLGASSNVTDTVSLALRWSTPLGTDSSLTINAGANASRNRSVGAELIPANPEATAAGQALVALANGSDSLGATVGLALPLLAADGLRVDFDAMYGLTYNDPTAGAPEGAAAAGLTAFTSHTLIATLRGSWGRGPLETAGDEDRTEQNAFANNPQSGSPLVSARLLNLRGQGLAEGSRGIAPGRAPASARAAPDERRRSQDAAQGVGRSESATAVEQASHRELDADAPKPPAPTTARVPRRAPVVDGLELVPTRPTPPPPPSGEAKDTDPEDGGATDAEAQDGEAKDGAPEGDATKADDDEDDKKRAPAKTKRKAR